MTFTDDDLKRLKAFIHLLDKNGGVIGQDFIVESKLVSLIARLEAAEKVALVADIDYALTNIWAIDRKRFEAEFLPRIKEALEAWRKAAGK